uniref:Integrin-linked kinase-associated serine/threonine phosphatase n=1 Tax=Callorhinchus milii TaxID=7868 RepID=A0A4W3IT81_CALMI
IRQFGGNVGVSLYHKNIKICNDVEKAGPSLFDDLLDVGNPDVAPRSPNLSGEIPKLPNDLKGEKRKAWNQNGSEEHTKKLCKGLVTLKGYVAERKGEREEMQDAHVIINNFTEEFTQLPQEISRLSYFAVFDGHGGMRASKYAAQNLHLNLVKNFPKGNCVATRSRKKYVRTLEVGEMGIGGGIKRQTIGSERPFNLSRALLNNW